MLLLVLLQFQSDSDASALYGHYRRSFFGDLDAYCFHDDVEGEEGTQLGNVFIYIVFSCLDRSNE